MQTTIKKPLTISMIEGYYITPTEKAAIKAVIKSGQTFGRNRPNTKTYTVESGWIEGGFYCYRFKIGSYGTWTIGANPSWRYQTVTVKTNKTI